jgi:hypothetical protein
MLRAFWLHLAFALALGMQGCALVGVTPESREGGATLGQAAAQAADSSHKHRRLVAGRPEPPPWTSVETSAEITPSALNSPEDSGPRVQASGASRHFHLDLVGAGGALGGNQYDGVAIGGIGAGGYEGRVRYDIVGQISSVNFAGESLAGQGLTHGNDLALDVSGRYYLTAGHTFMGLYPLAGVRFGTLFWSFRKDIHVVVDGENRSIGNDFVNWWAFYAGAGASLIQTRHFHLGVNVVGGVRLYDDRTFEGLQNDLFPSTGFSQIGLEATIGF